MSNPQPSVRWAPKTASDSSAVSLTRSVIYPSLVGNDIGCGMTLVATPLKVRAVVPLHCN